AALTIACTAGPQAGGGGTATPTASATSSPAPSATAQPPPTPTAAPQAAYLDDRSSAEQVVRSYYDAIGRRPYIRAYAYWEPSSTLPTYDAFAKGFVDTTAVQVELGTIGGGVGAGQLYWSMPAAVTATTSAGSPS